MHRTSWRDAAERAASRVVRAGRGTATRCAESRGRWSRGRAPRAGTCAASPRPTCPHKNRAAHHAGLLRAAAAKAEAARATTAEAAAALRHRGCATVAAAEEEASGAASRSSNRSSSQKAAKPSEVTPLVSAAPAPASASPLPAPFTALGSAAVEPSPPPPPTGAAPAALPPPALPPCHVRCSMLMRRNQEYMQCRSTDMGPARALLEEPKTARGRAERARRRS